MSVKSGDVREEFNPFLPNYKKYYFPKNIYNETKVKSLSSSNFPQCCRLAKSDFLIMENFRNFY